MKVFVLITALVFPLLAVASDGPAQARSAGRYLADDSVDLAEKLSQRPIDEILTSGKPRKLFGTDQGVAEREAVPDLAAHPLPVDFSIFDAWVQVSGDLDADGYFHRLNVVFDADTSADLETVYVKLYLSRNGGDWYQYANSDLFEIHFDSVDDTYEVMSELVEGYLPGQYDVLIELHSLYHPGIVASRIVEFDHDGYVITLEDLDHDDAMRHVVSDQGYVHGAGSMSIAGMLMYLLLLWVKFRYFRVEKSS